MQLLCPVPENDVFTWMMAQARELPVDPIGVIPERKMLTDTAGWHGERKFFHNLESMRSRLEHLSESDYHVDLGADVSTLYAAYYLINARKRVSVTVHYPPLLGGNADFWKDHELLRRKLAMYVLGRAKNVIVPSYQGADVLINAYPRLYLEPVLAASPLPLPDMMHDSDQRGNIAIFADFHEESNQAAAIMSIVAAKRQDPDNPHLREVELWGNGDKDKAQSLTDQLAKLTDIRWQINFGPTYQDLCDAASDARVVILPTITTQYGMTPYLCAAMAGAAPIMAVAEGSNVAALIPGTDAFLYKQSEPATFVAALRGLLAADGERSRLSENLRKKTARLSPAVLNERFLNLIGAAPEASNVGA